MDSFQQYATGLWMLEPARSAAYHVELGALDIKLYDDRVLAAVRVQHVTEAFHVDVAHASAMLFSGRSRAPIRIEGGRWPLHVHALGTPVCSQRDRVRRDAPF